MKITRYLWINDLPKNCEEEEIRKTFQRHGKIQNIRIHNNLKTRGAIVAFIDCKSSTKALQSVKTLQNIEVKLEYCEANGEPGIKSLGLPTEYSKNEITSDSSDSESSSSSSNTSSFGSSLDDYSKSPKRVISGKSSDRSSSKSRKSRQSSAVLVIKKDPDGLSKDCRGILVENLSQRSSDTSLREGLFHEFKKHGKITSVAVMGQGNGRHAIISFKCSEDMAKAYGVCQGKTFFGNQMRLTKHNGYNYIDPDLCPPEHDIDEYHPKATKTLFVGKLESGAVMEGDLRRVFKKYGEIIDIDIKNQTNQQDASFAFVQYYDISSVVRALKHQDSIKVAGKPVKLGFGKSQPANCLWVGNLHRGANESFLRRHFDRFGTVMLVVPDPEYKCALVQFENGDEALRAFTDTRERGNSSGGERIHVDYASNEYQMAFMNRLRESCQFDSEDFLKNIADPYQTEKLQTLLLSYTKYLELLDDTRARSRDRYDDGDDYYQSSGLRRRRDRDSVDRRHYNDDHGGDDDGYGRYKRHYDQYSSSRSPSRRLSRHHHEPSSSRHHYQGHTQSTRSPPSPNDYCDDHHRYNLSSARYNRSSKDYRSRPSPDKRDRPRTDHRDHQSKSHSTVKVSPPLRYSLKAKKTRPDEEIKLRSTVENKSKPTSNGYSYAPEIEKTVSSVVQPVDALSKLERERAKLLAELSLLTEDTVELSPNKTVKSVVKVAEPRDSKSKKKPEMTVSLSKEQSGLSEDKLPTKEEQENYLKKEQDNSTDPNIEPSSPDPPKEPSSPDPPRDPSSPDPPREPSSPDPPKDPSTQHQTNRDASTPKMCRDPRQKSSSSHSDLQSPITNANVIIVPLPVSYEPIRNHRTHKDSTSDSDLDHVNSFDFDVDKRIRELDEKMTRSEQSVKSLDYSKFRIRKKTDSISSATIPQSPNSSTSSLHVTSSSMFDVGYTTVNRDSVSTTSDFIKTMLNQTKPNSYHLLSDSISVAPCSMLPFRTVDLGSNDIERRSVFSKFSTSDNKPTADIPSLLPAYVPRLPTSTLPDKVPSSPTTPASAPLTPITPPTVTDSNQTVKSILKKSNPILKPPELVTTANKRYPTELSLSIDVTSNQARKSNPKPPTVVDLKRKIKSEPEDSVKKPRNDYGPVLDDSLFRTYPTLPKKKSKKPPKKPEVIPPPVVHKKVSSPIPERPVTKRTHSIPITKSEPTCKSTSKSKVKASKRKSMKTKNTMKQSIETVCTDGDDEGDEDLLMENGVDEVDDSITKYRNSKVSRGTKKKSVKEEVTLEVDGVDNDACWSAKSSKRVTQKRKRPSVVSDEGGGMLTERKYLPDEVLASNDRKRYSLRSKEYEYQRKSRSPSDDNGDGRSKGQFVSEDVGTYGDLYSSLQTDDLEEEVCLDEEHHEEEMVSVQAVVAADVNSASQILLTMRSQPTSSPLTDSDRQLQSVAEHLISMAQDPRDVPMKKEHSIFTVPSRSTDHNTSAVTVPSQVDDKYSTQSDEVASTSSTEKRIRHNSGKSEGQLQSLCDTIEYVVRGSMGSSVSDVISVKSITDGDELKSQVNVIDTATRKCERSSLDDTMDDVISKVNVKSPQSNGPVRTVPDNSPSLKTLISRDVPKPTTFYQFSGNVGGITNLVLGIPSITIVSQQNSMANTATNKLSNQICQPPTNNYTITSQPLNGMGRSTSQVLPGNSQGIFAKLNSLTPLMIQAPLRGITPNQATSTAVSSTNNSLNIVSLASLTATSALNLSKISVSPMDPNYYVMMPRHNAPLTSNVPISTHMTPMGHSIILSQLSNTNNRQNLPPTNGLINTCLSTGSSILLRPLNVYFPKFEEKDDWLKQNSQPEWNYPIRWTGKLCLKNDEVFVQMHMVAGNEDLLRNCMNLIPTGQNSSQYLRIVQRMRLEPNQLECLYRHLSRPIEFCTCLTLAGGDKSDELTRTSSTLNENFIKYLQNKSAAGIINISVPGSQQNAYVIHIFPPCDFSDNQLKTCASKLYEKLKENSIPYLVIVITTS